MRKLFTGYKTVFSHPEILLQHLRYQIRATTAAAVIQELFVSLQLLCMFAFEPDDDDCIHF